MRESHRLPLGLIVVVWATGMVLAAWMLYGT